MRKAKKIWLITAGVLLALGGLMFVGVMTALKWDFSKLATAKYETNTYAVDEAFTDIAVDAVTADVTVLLTDEAKCKVVCFAEEKMTSTVEIKDGKLIIKLSDNRSWYEQIGIGWKSPKITVYVPAAAYGDLKISCTTGDVEIGTGLSFESINVSVTTGDIAVKGIHTATVRLSSTTGDVKLTDVTCQSLVSDGTTGDVTLTRVIAEESLSIERGTGDVKLARCDAESITIKTTTGDVSGTLLSGKTFVAKATTGDVSVPASTEGGTCRITCTTGDINIKIAK